jgi:nucleoside-diphosphate-sugar epimerase
MHETESDALAAYRAVNVGGTRRWAEQEAAAGLRRVVFLSSIGVNGIHTNGCGAFFLGSPRGFAPSDYEAGPVEDYAISNWEAE